MRSPAGLASDAPGSPRFHDPGADHVERGRVRLPAREAKRYPDRPRNLACAGGVASVMLLTPVPPSRIKISAIMFKKRYALMLRLACLWLTLGSEAPAQIPQTLTPVPLQQVQIHDAFWSPKFKLWREVTLADCFDKFDRDGTLDNFDKVRDGKGEHRQAPWFDGLLHEMIRAAADFLIAKPDPKLEARIDNYIEHIAAAAAKDPDGYINTYTQLQEPTHRWGANGGNDRWQHDLYNAGALVEAGVHYYRATGKTKLLAVAVKMANHMADVMGPPPKQNLIPGHALGEEALVNLYQLFQAQPQLKARLSVPVAEQRYLELAEFWIDARGHHEGRNNYGAYDQDEIPVGQQQTIEGHAVRGMLLCNGLLAAGAAAKRPEYLTTAQRLWTNMVTRRMYLTGGVGAIANDEKFGDDYVLPNTGYAETCAAVAAAFFHEHMNLAFGDAGYADELERVLYNGLLSGVGERGNCYFYENPLEASPQHKRWDWHPCPCCPPMFLKVVGELPSYIYAQNPEGLFVNLFIGSQANLVVSNTKVALQLVTQYPWEGAVKLTVNPEHAAAFAMNLRLPGWCKHPEIRVNGRWLKEFKTLRGYARIEREWKRGDTIELTMPMPVQRVYANPKVVADQGRVALQRGPLVYCLEGMDNGGNLRHLVIPPDAKFTAAKRADLLAGVTVIRGNALALHQTDWVDSLYKSGSTVPGATNVEFMAIPYFANANRQPTDLMVWMAESLAQASPLPPPSIASPASVSASHCFANDTTSALNDQLIPKASDDQQIPRFTWWDHRGTKEWVQYDFEKPQTISSADVYWWDERRLQENCRVPQSWRLLYKEAATWKPVSDDADWRPVPDASAYGTEMDQFNRVSFAPVTAKALRLEVQLQPEWSGGILEWQVK